MLNDDKNYKFGIFYYNKENPQLFVKNTKKADNMNANAINCAHPIGKLVLFVISLTIILAIVSMMMT